MSGTAVQLSAALREPGCDVDAANEHGKTALMVAAWRGPIENVELLLAGGADPDLFATGPSNFGQTAVFFAVTRKRGDVVTLLLQNGATVLFRSWNGATPATLSKAFLPEDVQAAVAGAQEEQLSAGKAWRDFSQSADAGGAASGAQSHQSHSAYNSGGGGGGGVGGGNSNRYKKQQQQQQQSGRKKQIMQQLQMAPAAGTAAAAAAAVSPIHISKADEAHLQRAFAESMATVEVSVEGKPRDSYLLYLAKEGRGADLGSAVAIKTVRAVTIPGNACQTPVGDRILAIQVSHCLPVSAAVCLSQLFALN
jgi:hypothetical protein